MTSWYSSPTLRATSVAVIMSPGCSSLAIPGCFSLYVIVIASMKPGTAPASSRMLPFAASTLTIFPLIGKLFNSPATEPAVPPDEPTEPLLVCLQPATSAGINISHTAVRHAIRKERLLPHEIGRAHTSELQSPMYLVCRL